MLWEIFMFLVIIWLLQRRWNFRKQIALANKIGTSLKSYPIVGHAYMFSGTGEDRMRAFETFGREAFKTGGLSPIWLNELFILVSDPVSSDILLNRCLQKKEMIQIIFSFVIGGGSLYASVPIWRARRKMVVPTFSTRNLNNFTKVFADRSIAMVRLMEKEAGRGVFSFWGYIIDCTLDSACENTLGVDFDIQDLDISVLKRAIEDLFRVAASRICQPWFHSDFMFKVMPEFEQSIQHRDTIRTFIAKVIKDKRKQLQKEEATCTPNEIKTEKASSFLDQLIESSADAQKLSDLELLEEAIVLVIAGLDTSATGAGFTALMLGRYPDVQEKVYEELKEVFGTSERPITSADLSRLKYLEAVIKEVMRLFPPIPLITRQTDTDVTLPSGLTIPKGCGVLVNIWAVHRNPGYWGEDAEQFRPERFLSYYPAHPAQYMPFSYGARNCIGYQYAMLSMKTALATLLRRYKVLPPPGVTKNDPVRTSFDIILRQVDKFQIRIEHRQ